MRIASRETERRVAAQLGITPIDLARACLERWGHGFTDERDHRLNQTLDQENASAGLTLALARNITAQLKDELEDNGPDHPLGDEDDDGD